MPTLPAFTTRVPPIVRSNCMCVCPHTTADTASPSNTGTSRSSGVRRVKISRSFRGVAWQNSTSPSGPIRTRTVLGHRAGEDIAADDDLIHVRLTDLLEDRLQRRQIAVDVVDGGDTHWRAPIAAGRRYRCGS